MRCFRREEIPSRPWYSRQVKNHDDAIGGVSLFEGQLMPRGFAPRRRHETNAASVFGLGRVSSELGGTGFSLCSWISQGQCPQELPSGSGLKSVLLNPSDRALARRQQTWSDPRQTGHFHAAGSALTLAHSSAASRQRGNPRAFRALRTAKTEPQRVGHGFAKYKNIRPGEHHTPVPAT